MIFELIALPLCPPPEDQEPCRMDLNEGGAKLEQCAQLASELGLHQAEATDSHHVTHDHDLVLWSQSESQLLTSVSKVWALCHQASPLKKNAEARNRREKGLQGQGPVPLYHLQFSDLEQVTLWNCAWVSPGAKVWHWIQGFPKSIFHKP